MKYSLLPGLVLAILLIAGCDEPRLSVISGPTMGTSYTIKIVTIGHHQKLSDDELAQLETDVKQALIKINALMSTYHPDSELSRFNQSETMRWFPVSPETREVLETSLWLSQVSEGAFDVTVGPLVNLWGFGPVPAKDELPEAQAIAEAMGRVGYQYLELEGDRIRKQRNIYVDLSAVAKGYAVDYLAMMLDNKGLKNYLVEIGGELRARGNNQNGSPWVVAIEKPDVNQRAIYSTLALKNTAVATSGDYRNFFLLDGKMYSHSINPVTGYPVSHHLASVTVLAGSTLLADGWATTLNVLGDDDGLQLAESREIAALFIVREEAGFREIPTRAFKAYLDKSAVAEGGSTQ